MGRVGKVGIGYRLLGNHEYGEVDTLLRRGTFAPCLPRVVSTSWRLVRSRYNRSKGSGKVQALKH